MLDMNDLAARLKAKRKDKELTQEALGAAVGVTKQAISAIELRTSLKPDYDTITRIARVLDVDTNWLRHGRATSEGDDPRLIDAPISLPETHPGYVRFRVMEGGAGAGYGMVNQDYPEVIQEVEVAEWQVRQHLGFVPTDDRVQLITVRGDSMYPHIKNGDVVMVDTACSSFISDGMYVINLHGFTLVKLLQLMPDGIHIISTNQKYAAAVIAPGEFDSLHVSGKVGGVVKFRNAEEH